MTASRRGPLGEPRRTRMLAATILGSGMAFLDGTVVNIALPHIGAEFGAGRGSAVDHQRLPAHARRPDPGGRLAR